MELDVLGSAPIPGDNPAGADVRGSAAFEALQGEIDRPNDTANPGQTDWSNVIKLASAITAEQGKDLLVGSYLAVGLMQQQQAAGFAPGLKVLRDMIVTHWDGLFPPAKRMRGRRNALQYWLDRCDEQVRTWSVPPLEQSAIDAMLQHVDDIDAVLREKDDEPPGVFRLAQTIKGFPVHVEAAPAEETPAESASDAGTEASEAAAVPSAPTSIDEAWAVAANGLATLRMAGDFLFESDLTQPLPYRIVRWAAWSALTDLPYADAGTTALEAPYYYTLEAAESLSAAGDHEAMIRFVQAQLPDNPLWLDLNRLQAQALGALGEGYQAAAAAVRAEAALLAARLPGLAELKFSDGTPFASAQTLEWLQSVAGGASAPAGGGSSGPSTEVREAIKTATGKVADGDLPAAMSALQRAIDRSPLARDRFHARVSLCSILIEQQAAANPWPFVRSLLDDIDRHRLDDWDPALALSGLRLAYAALAAAGEGAAGSVTPNDLLQRIARLDCVQALQLSGVQ
jgi:type VI secretion system protein VasJ